MTNTPLGTDSTTEYYKRLSEEYNKGLSICEADYRELVAKYDELLDQITTLHGCETRHQTALRYIKAMEAQANGMTTMTNEIRNLLSVCHIHLNSVEKFLEVDQPMKAEFRARELSENAKLLSNALYAVQRRSGEVK